MSIIEKVTELCKETVEGCGVSLCEVTLVTEDDGTHLTFFIDKDSGVTLDDCEKVSKAVDPILDAAGIDIDHLDVSSLGVDHPSKIKGGE
ncbi:MAG: hypothetical protein FWE38_04490 [Firmicutes bacterium]|nr:hypothetical protein [Bacillota bacterium]